MSAQNSFPVVLTSPVTFASAVTFTFPGALSPSHVDASFTSGASVLNWLLALNQGMNWFSSGGVALANFSDLGGVGVVKFGSIATPLSSFELDATTLSIEITNASVNCNDFAFNPGGTFSVNHVSGGGSLWTWPDGIASASFNNAGLFISGAKILGVQGAAIADPAGGAIIDVQARAQLTLLLAALRAATGHGLIA